MSSGFTQNEGEPSRPRLKGRRGLVLALQILFVLALIGFLAYAVRGTWDEALPRLRDARPLELGLACLILAAYYLLFIVGWVWILAALEIRTSYRVALQAEMVSMLAKYIPGGVWTPAARLVAMRRAGITNTPVVLVSILIEAALSAVAGIFVFVVGLLWVSDVDAPLLPLAALAAVCVIPLHPRIFRPLAGRVLRRFGTVEIPTLPLRTSLRLVVFYSFTWLVGGAALFFLLRSVGGEPDVLAIAFLGGTSAVGAIVAVLVIFAPSGLGVREASMYGLLLAVVSEGVALGATVLNRLTITAVEAALLLIPAASAWRLRGRKQAGADGR